MFVRFRSICRTYRKYRYARSPRGKKRPRRPNFPYEFKIALVEQSLQPRTCVAQIARENGINDNLLFNCVSVNRLPYVAIRQELVTLRAQIEKLRRMLFGTRSEKLRREVERKRAARTVLTGMCYSVGSATRQGSSSPTRFIGQSAMTSRT